ncbi:tetratricopeptide repeat protein [Bradyrhizobium guangxiense]
MSLAKDDVDRAIADYDRALLIHPDNVHAHIGRSFAYEIKGESDRAFADCARAIEIGPDHWIGRSCRADIYLALGKTELALVDFDHAVQLGPKDPRPYLGRARVFQARGDLAKALSNLDQAIEMNPNGSVLHRFRGTLHFQSGHLTEAFADLNRSNELDRKDAYTQLWLHLARRRSGDGSDLNEAAKLIDPSRWPAPIVRFFLGEMTFEDLLKAAQDNSVRRTKEQICEANFYAGELAMERGLTRPCGCCARPRTSVRSALWNGPQLMLSFTNSRRNPDCRLRVTVARISSAISGTVIPHAAALMRAADEADQTGSNYSAPRFFFALNWPSSGPAVSAAVSAAPGSRAIIAATMAPTMRSSQSRRMGKAKACPRFV